MRGHLPVYRFIWTHLCWCNIHSLTTEERLHSMKALIKIKFTFSDIFEKCFLWRTTAEATLTFRNTAKSTFWNRLYYSWTWQIWEIHKGTDLQFLKKRVDVFDIKNNIKINLEQNLNERFADWIIHLDTPQTQDLCMHVYMLVFQQEPSIFTVFM